MILDFISDNLDGDSWEQWCDSCYRDRYQLQNYRKIPAIVGGDAGIEGFTQEGIAYQCYCPERQYSDNELYDHLRDKMTRDIAKLLADKNGKRLKGMGVPPIKEWHFVIPQYKDARILTHAATKTDEVLSKKAQNPKEYEYIDDNFRIYIKEAEDFKVELTRIIRNTLVDPKLNLAVKMVKEVDWTKCETEKVENIKRKIKAVTNLPEEDDDFKDVVQFYVEAYLKGIEILNSLRVSYSEIYEDLHSLEQQYKRDVSIKTKMSTDHSMNNTLFNQILNEFEDTLAQEFTYFSKPSIMELKHDLISGWLADCSMEFRNG